MGARSRYDMSSQTGTRTRKDNGTVGSSTYLTLEEQCDDFTGADNQPFKVHRVKRYGGLINGVNSSSIGYIWKDYPNDFLKSDPYVESHVSVPGQPSDGVLAQAVIARTNPSRSSTQALEAVADIAEFGKTAFGEFGKRLRNLGRHYGPKRFNALSRVAKGSLMIQFGLVPLVNDINVLLKFQDLVDARVREIERLRTRGLRRTVDCWSGATGVTILNQTIQSNGCTIRAKFDKTTTVRVRGHIRWYANSNWLLNDKSVQAVARKAITGYVLDPSTLYEIMPWSWLIDYFSNLGNFVKGSRNMFDAHHDKVRIMHERTTHLASRDINVVSPGTIKCSDFEAYVEDLDRVIATPSLSAYIEFLQPAQWSILSSLSVVRGLR